MIEPSQFEEEIDLRPSPAIIIPSIGEQIIPSNEWYEEDGAYGPFEIRTPLEDDNPKPADS